MEFLECVKKRRSIRKYTDESLDHGTFEAIVQAASFAPSWKNSQIVRYHLIETKSLKETIAANCVMGSDHNAEIVRGAAALVVVSMITCRCGYERDGSFTTSKEDRWEMFDAGIASQTFCLAAQDQGVGTVILGIFDEHQVAQAISLPENQKVAALIAIGYPAETPNMPKRKEVADLVSYK